jgi:hypothetical protein
MAAAGPFSTDQRSRGVHLGLGVEYASIGAAIQHHAQRGPFADRVMSRSLASAAD